VLAGATLGVVYLISSGALGGGGNEEDPPVVEDSRPVALADAIDFDPEGTSGEHPEETQNAIDDDPQTAWTTETYEQPDYVKEGVGLIVEAERAVNPSSIEIRTPDPGWSMTLYGSGEPYPETVDGWTELESVESIGDTERIVLDGGQSFRYFLIWSTTPGETPEGYGASVAEVEISD
jgi:putative peptidoglycan lipid II flippase